MSRPAFVYTLAFPGGRVFYVGKAIRVERMECHEKEARRGLSQPKHNAIRQIWSDGGEVVKTIVEHFHSEDEAFAAEIALIASLGRTSLTNLTSGGDGIMNYEYGPDHGRRVSEAQRGKPLSTAQREAVSRAQRGKPKSPEHRQKLREAAQRRARENPASYRRGSFSEEHRQRLKEAAIRRNTAEYRAKMSATRKGRTLSEQARANIAASRRGTTIPEDVRKKMSESHRNSPKSRTSLEAMNKRNRERRAARMQEEDADADSTWNT